MKQIQFISASHYQTSDRFYALPKVFFENPIYEDMRLDAKVAYAMLKDRLDLSFKNNWIDENGNIYLVYSNSNLMKILSCSKSTLLRIKKQLTEYGLIHEVQQSTSKSGNLANRIYLGLLQDDTVARMVDKSGDSKSDTRGVSDLDQGGVKKTPGGCQIYTGLVSNLAPNDTEYSETNNNETELCISEEDEEKATQNSKNKDPNSLFRRVDKVTKYALENMRFARSSEIVAEYVFNGIVSELNQTIRRQQS